MSRSTTRAGTRRGLAPPRGRRGPRASSWPSTAATAASDSAASRLSSTTEDARALAPARRARRPAAARHAPAHGVAERQAHLELAAAAGAVAARPAPCRRAARPGAAPASGRCPGRLRALERCVDLHEHVEDARSAASAAMPMPVSRTRDQRVCAVAPRDASMRDAAAAVVNLQALLSRLPTHLGEPGRRRRRATAARRATATVRRCGRASHSGGRLRPRWPRHRAQIDPLALQLELAAADAAHVEQVVHQAHHVADLALHHLAHAAPRPRGRCGRPAA